MLANISRQLDLLPVREPCTYHDAGRFGFFAVVHRGEERQKRHEEQLILRGMSPAAAREKSTRRGVIQRMYKLKDMAAVLERLNPKLDTWISQSEFGFPVRADGMRPQPNRRAVNVIRLPLCFVDLDVKVQAGDVDACVSNILMDTCELNLPQPSLIVFSGRGFHLKWLLEKPLPRQAVVRWNAVQQALVNAYSTLPRWCCDKAARDVSRVLRLDRTVNTKSNEVCRVAHVTEASGAPRSYAFEALSREVLPLERPDADRGAAIAQLSQKPQLVRQRANTGENKGSRSLNGRKLSWDRLEDIRRLAAMRAASGTLVGCREELVFWAMNFMALAGAVLPHQIPFEAAELAKQIDPTWREHSWKSQLATVMAKAEQFGQGLTVDHKGTQMPALYTPRNQTLMDKLRITSDEELQLGTIISKRVARKRDAARASARRRAAGVLPRSEYLASAMELKEKALALRGQGMTVREVAEELGISSAHAARVVIP